MWSQTTTKQRFWYFFTARKVLFCGAINVELDVKKIKNIHALKVIIFENPKHHKQIPSWCGKLAPRVFQSLP